MDGFVDGATAGAGLRFVECPMSDQPAIWAEDVDRRVPTTGDHRTDERDDRDSEWSI